MAKKNKKNKKSDPKNMLGVYLRKHKDDIIISNEGKKKVTLCDVTETSASNATAVPFDAVIPVSADKAAKEKKVDFRLDAHFSPMLYKLYEFIITKTAKYTAILTLDVEDLDCLWFLPTIEALAGKTNISLIADAMDRQFKKLDKWADTEPEEELDMFVIHIPDIVLFREKPVAEAVASQVQFDLILQFVKGKKSIKKTKKKKPEILNKFVVKCTAENIKSFGETDIILQVSDAFSKSYYDLGEAWIDLVKNDDTFKKVVNQLNFVSGNSDAYIMLSGEINRYEESCHKA